MIESDADGRIRDFHEKPADPPSMPGDPSQAFASMGNYIFSTDVLEEAVREDAESRASEHDMGGNIIPTLTQHGSAFVYDFASNDVPGQSETERGYWRDVGTIDAYYEASMDLVRVEPIFNFYNYQWPIFTWNFPDPPAKFVLDDEDRPRIRDGFDRQQRNDRIRGVVRRSILSPRVRVHSYSEVSDSVILSGVTVGRNAVVRNAIVDKNVDIPEGYQIGVDPAEDAARFTVSAGGVIVIGKSDILT